MWSTLSVDITPGQSSVRLSQDRPTDRYYIALYHTYVLGTTGLICWVMCVCCSRAALRETPPAPPVTQPRYPAVI